MEHNLPIEDKFEKPIGRLNFSIEMEHVTNVAVLFHHVQLKHLTAINGKECNPYLKYAFSLNWQAVEDGKMKANYTPVIENCTDPRWTNLPDLRIKTSLRVLLRESIVLHVTHKSKYTSVTLGKCNVRRFC